MSGGRNCAEYRQCEEPCGKEHSRDQRKPARCCSGVFVNHSTWCTHEVLYLGFIRCKRCGWWFQRKRRATGWLLGGLDAAVQRTRRRASVPVFGVSAAISNTFVVAVHRRRLGKSPPNALATYDDDVIACGATRRAATAKSVRRCGGHDLRRRAGATARRHICPRCALRVSFEVLLRATANNSYRTKPASEMAALEKRSNECRKVSERKESGRKSVPCALPLLAPSLRSRQLSRAPLNAVSHPGLLLSLVRRARN